MISCRKGQFLKRGKEIERWECGKWVSKLSILFLKLKKANWRKAKSNNLSSFSFIRVRNQVLRKKENKKDHTLFLADYRKIEVKVFLESESQVKVYFKLWTEKVGWREVAARGGEKEVPSEEKTSKRKYASLKEILILICLHDVFFKWKWINKGWQYQLE